MRLLRLMLVACSSVTCMYAADAAEISDHEPLPDRQHGDWWLGLDAGAGAITIEFPQGELNETKFYLGVRAEYVLNPVWLVGIEASGWLIQPGEIEYNANLPPANFERQLEGEGVAPILMTTRYYPWTDDNWYVKAGAGYVNHWVTQQGVTERKSGAAVMVGVGYDFVVNEHWDITTFVSYGSGRPGDESYDAITLAIGFNYKIRRKK